MDNPGDPIDALAGIVQSTSLRAADLQCGSPLNNLAQEMSPLDEGFRKGWIAAALREGQKRGVVRSDVDPNETATFVIAAYEGYISLTKNAQDVRVLQSGKRSIPTYCEKQTCPACMATAALAIASAMSAE